MLFPNAVSVGCVELSDEFYEIYRMINPIGTFFYSVIPHSEGLELEPNADGTFSFEIVLGLRPFKEMCDSAALKELKDLMNTDKLSPLSANQAAMQSMVP